MSNHPFHQSARLETRTGDFVQDVLVPKFIDKPPEIVNWGERFFVLNDDEPLTYREGLMVSALIPNQSRP